MGVITLHRAVGNGSTALAAFDSALLKCGIGNSNLIYLSSVIPPNTELAYTQEPVSGEVAGGWGDRLYVVMAERRATERGTMVAAGIGWVQDSSKKGLFVEHVGASEDEVKERIEATLNSMVKDRPDEKFGPIQSLTVAAECYDEPVCALAVAVYKSERW